MNEGADDVQERSGREGINVQVGRPPSNDLDKQSTRTDMTGSASLVWCERSFRSRFVGGSGLLAVTNGISFRPQHAVPLVCGATSGLQKSSGLVAVPLYEGMCRGIKFYYVPSHGSVI